ncbi:putative inorganic phosphate cotransporter isoform X2 [Agrilus planipennis]|uniref:Inorganic phosphate cotransporter isoform X2 n=1 Tax=Agrilus planipennis TaxID=224129 RepID=A0A7F5RMF7_AGRPL|nr:putative inorganic phosphate cotransporter isoform X2 [Agrilus planipennis]
MILNKKVFLIPQRWVLGIMGFLAILNAYSMRVTLSIAITEMVVSSNKSSNYSDACPSYESSSGSTSSSVIKDPSKLYNWDEATQGIILSSFYYGYVVTHLPGGLLAEKFGGKYTLGIGMLSTAVLTVLTPLVIKFGDWQGLVVLRVLMGLGEGTTFPALSVLLAKWVPTSERSKLGSLAYSGSVLGTVFSNSVSGVLISATEDWASVFYFFGGIGILWYIIWELICFSSPESHPYITDKEKNYLEKELGATTTTQNTPWKQILTSVPVWALIAAQIGHDWGNYAMVTDLPKYMSDVLNFNVTQNGLWSSLPYVVMWIVSMVFGWFCDWHITKGYTGITFARKFYTAVGAIGPGIFMLAASYAGCDRMLAVIMFTVAMGFMGTFYCGMKVNTLDLSPNYAGTIMAIQNGLGAITGIIAPYLIGILTEDNTVTQWRLVFWITFAVFAITTVIFVIFGSGDRQWWNDIGMKVDAASSEIAVKVLPSKDNENITKTNNNEKNQL